MEGVGARGRRTPTLTPAAVSGRVKSRAQPSTIITTMSDAAAAPAAVPPAAAAPAAAAPAAADVPLG